MQIELRNYKQQIGRQGEGFVADLVIDGTARGRVIDEANGGCLSYDDYRASQEIEEFAKQFATEDDHFELGDQLVNVLAYRADAQKKLAKAFNESLVFVDKDGLVAWTKKIKGDVAATKAKWMADASTLTKLHAKEFVTDKNEMFRLYFEQEEFLQHPALKIKAVTKKVAPVVVDAAEKLAEYFKEADKIEPKKKSTGNGSGTGNAAASKMDLCRAIYKEHAGEGTSRKDIIALFVAQIGMSAAGASTYYQKLKGE